MWENYMNLYLDFIYVLLLQSKWWTTCLQQLLRSVVSHNQGGGDWKLWKTPVNSEHCTCVFCLFCVFKVKPNQIYDTNMWLTYISRSTYYDGFSTEPSNEYSDDVWGRCDYYICFMTSSICVVYVLNVYMYE